MTKRGQASVTNDESDEDENVSQKGGHTFSVNKYLTGMRVTNATKVSPFNGDPSDYQSFKETFQTLFPNKCAPNAMLISQLIEYLATDVRLRVAECFKVNTRYDFVWERPDGEAGDSARSSKEIFNTIIDMPAVKGNDGVGLRDFILNLHATVVAMFDNGLQSELKSPVQRARLERKLPQRLLKDLVRYVSSQK